MTVRDNPTRARLVEAIEQRRFGVPLDANPAFVSLDAVLLDGQPGDVTLGFTARPEMLQGNGVIGGGAMASMLDCALATAVVSMLPFGQTCATISLTVQMQRAASVGAMRAHAKVERCGQRVAFSQAQLFDADGRLVASGSASLAVLPEAPPA